MADVQYMKGDKGDQGPQGEKGEKGNTGAQGPQGLQGVQGDKGDTGPQGPQGIQGERGPRGFQGDKGNTGETGSTGAQGPPGANGSDGAVGPQGPQGDPGDTGPQGPQGDPGTDGSDGLDITWRGAYNGATAYVVNDAVSYNGSSYICKQNSTGNLPTNSTYWDQMAAKGDTGPQGPAGSGSGDMLAADYDPQAIQSDAFDQDNMTDGTTNKNYTATEKTKLAGIEDAADVTDAGNVGSAIHGATGKTTPVDADELGLIDSAASNVLKKLTWANLKATVKSYFDTLYAAISHTHAESDITNLTTDLANKQPLDSDLTTIAGLTATTDNFMVANASAWASRTPAQARTHMGLGALATLATVGTSQIDDASVTLAKMANLSANSIIGNNTGSPATPLALTAAQVRTLLSLVPGTDVQAYDADLATIAGLTATTDNFMVATASAWASRTPSQARTQMGLGSLATLSTVTETEITLADNTTNNSSTTKHGFLKKLSNSATDFMDGTGAWDTIKDSDLSTSDITTNDVSTTKHGFAPKAVAGKYLRSDGWAGIPPFFNHIESGCVWSGDSYGSTRAASMTSGVVWINGVRLTVAAVSARTFTASKDTYVDFQDNGDGTASITYTEATNNAASPALPNSGTDANTVRCAIIVTGASSIANAGSVNQGQENKVLPIASSIPYAVTDSLGYLICPRDPFRRLLGYRQNVTDFTTNSTTDVDFTELNLFVNVPANRKVKLILSAPQNYNAGGATNRWNVVDVTNSNTSVWAPHQNVGNTVAIAFTNEIVITPPASGARQYKVRINVSGGTYHSSGAATSPASFKVELV